MAASPWPRISTFPPAWRSTPSGTCTSPRPPHTCLPPSPLHHRVRKVDKATGIITTVAGTGAPVPYTGEYQFATLANITAPIRVVFDHADNFYINGATGNNRIQKVDAATGLITTVAGHLNGEPCAAPAPCGDGGMATDAWVTGALPGSTFDAAGNFYFSGSNRVRKITARVIGGVAQPLDGTETVTAFAGTGRQGTDTSDNIDATLAELNSPRSLAIDPSGENLYIADLGNHLVRKVNLTTGIITTAVGMAGVACSPNTDPCGDGQPVEVATITSPTNVSFDSHGNLYVNSQTRHSEGRHLGDHHDGGRHRSPGLLRRRRPGIVRRP